MPLHIIIGAQWGDEGKGRILDAIAAEAAVVARFSGGSSVEAAHLVLGADLLALDRRDALVDRAAGSRDR